MSEETSLPSSISDSSARLGYLTVQLRKRFFPNLPNELLRHAIEQLERANALLKDMELASNARDAALARAEALLEPTIDEDDPLQILVDGKARPFALERYLALQSYATSSWACYDALWEAASALLWPNWSGNRSGALVKDGWAGDTGKKFPAALPLIGMFGWAVTWSYTVRNHFVHEPYTARNIDLFDGKGWESGFVGRELREQCDAEARSKKDMSPNLTWRAESWPWGNTDDILYLLRVCHTDVDHFFRSLMSSSVLSAQTMLLHFDSAKASPAPQTEPQQRTSDSDAQESS